MFDKQYYFRGTHAKKVNRLTAQFDGKRQLFNKNYDVYTLAPIVGFLYNMKAELNREDSEETTIMPDMLMKNKDELMFNYRLIMLLDKQNEPDIEKRIDKAFRLYGTEEAINDEKLFESYVRGGVDKIHEKLLENSDDYIRNLYEFVEEIDERYNSRITSESISDLCRIAKS